MKISFVIPAYNEEKYIGKCLGSISEEIARSGADAEIIVVNNASTDNTEGVASSFPGVRVVTESRKGIVLARQKGFEVSTGDLIANIDSDVVLTEGWINKVLKEFNSNPKLVCLSGPFILYDLPWWTAIWVKTFYFLGYISYLFHRFVLRRSGMAQGGNFVVSKKAMEKIGGFNTSIEFYGEDTDIAKRLLKVGVVKFTFGLPVLSSGRRLAAEGVLRSGAKYFVNYLWIVFTGRPYHKDHVDVRPENQA